MGTPGTDAVATIISPAESGPAFQRPGGRANPHLPVSPESDKDLWTAEGEECGKGQGG
jgi:hypothetical protein